MIWMLRLKFLRTKHLLHYKVETFVYSLKLQFIYVNIKKKQQQKNTHTPMRFIECSLSSKKRKQNISMNISVFDLLSAIHTAVFALKITHQSQYLSNCAPTPPLIQH